MDLRKEVKDFFSETGKLSNRYKKFEHRSSQEEMAVSVIDNLESQSHIFIEAPTGVGKSFAYLVPSIYYAVKNKKKAIISTYSPILSSIIPTPFSVWVICAALIKRDASSVLV